MKGKRNKKPSRRAKSMAMLFAKVSVMNNRLWHVERQMDEVVSKIFEHEHNIYLQKETISNYWKAVEAQSVALQSLSKLVDRVLNQKKKL